MQKIILALCLGLAVVTAHSSVVSDVLGEESFSVVFRSQHANVLKDYDTKLEQLRKHYEGRVDGVDIHHEFVSNSLRQVNVRLNPIEVLSDYTSACVTKHRSEIPTVINVKTAITECVLEARNQTTVLLTGALEVRNALEKYFEEHFENEIKGCEVHLKDSEKKYVACISSVNDATNKHIAESQKEFEVQLEAAVCIAKANIKKALDCSYTVQDRTITAIARATLLINHCVEPENECKPCDYHCNDVLALSAKELSGEQIHNPFYGRTDDPKCLIVAIE